MNKAFAGLTASILAVGVLGISALAAPAKTAGMKATKVAATLKCPACGMSMPSKKTAEMPVPVNIKGHTYYCCTKCAAGKAHMKKA